MSRPIALLSIVCAIVASEVRAGTPANIVYCIDDSSEFTSVLSAMNALQAHNQSYELRFRPGTFPSNTSYQVGANTRALIAWRPNWVISYDNYHFKISGEWNAGCTAQNPPGGTTSTINALDLYAIFYVDEVGYSNTNYTPLVITIDRMDFWRFSGAAVSASARGAEHSLRIDSSRFRSGVGQAVSSNADSIVIQNSLFELNSTGGNFLEIVSVDSDGATSMTNNTFRNNTLSSGSQRSLVDLGNPVNSAPSGLAVFENNIIFQTVLSAPSKLLSTDTLARIRNNIFDSALVAGTPLFISNNYNVDPKFAFVSGAHLLTDSPARDLGNNASTNGATLDLYGRVRVQNLVVDLGAYELTPVQDNVFANSFE